MTNEKLYEVIGDINEQHILEAKQSIKKKPLTWKRWVALAACLCFVIGISTFFIKMSYPSSPKDGFTASHSILLQPHREDFSPEIDPNILAQFENPDTVIKSYSLRTNKWFLSDKLEDFSQVMTTDVSYIRPGGYNGENTHESYTYYTVNEKGELEWLESWVVGGIGNGQVTPNGFLALSYEVIDEALSDIEYEDYIVTHAERLGLVLVWVRCETDDLILTYPSHPAWSTLEIGGIYTLEELQEHMRAVISH